MFTCNFGESLLTILSPYNPQYFCLVFISLRYLLVNLKEGKRKANLQLLTLIFFVIQFLNFHFPLLECWTCLQFIYLLKSSPFYLHTNPSPLFLIAINLSNKNQAYSVTWQLNERHSWKQLCIKSSAWFSLRLITSNLSFLLPTGLYL